LLPNIVIIIIIIIIIIINTTLFSDHPHFLLLWYCIYLVSLLWVTSHQL